MSPKQRKHHFYAIEFSAVVQLAFPHNCPEEREKKKSEIKKKSKGNPQHPHSPLLLTSIDIDIITKIVYARIHPFPDGLFALGAAIHLCCSLKNLLDVS